MKRLILMAAGLAMGAVALGAGSAPALAQQNENNAWVKICTTNPESQKTLCLVTQELRTSQGQFLASLALREVPGEARRTLLASVPVGMVLKPGVAILVDGQNPVQVPYSICFPNACYAEMTIDDAFIERLKRGGKLQMVTYNQTGKQVQFDMTLIGFTAAFDGEGIDPQALQQKQADLQRQLDRRAQEARDRLVAEQRKAIDNATQ